MIALRNEVESVDIIEELCSCHDDQTCPTVVLAREWLALRSKERLDAERYRCLRNPEVYCEWAASVNMGRLSNGN